MMGVPRSTQLARGGEGNDRVRCKTFFRHPVLWQGSQVRHPSSNTNSGMLETRKSLEQGKGVHRVQSKQHHGRGGGGHLLFLSSLRLFLFYILSLFFLAFVVSLGPSEDFLFPLRVKEHGV